jgi:DNA end-binding protein Ku
MALRELVDAKLKYAPITMDEAPAGPNNVVNLMDALRKSIVGDAVAKQAPPKKPVVSAKEPAAKGIGLVKPLQKSSPRRKSA